MLGIEDRSSLAVYTSIQYRLHGPLTEEQVTRIARDLLANELIQRFEIKSRAQWDADPGLRPQGRPRDRRVLRRSEHRAALLDERRAAHGSEPEEHVGPQP